MESAAGTALPCSRGGQVGYFPAALSKTLCRDGIIVGKL